MWRILLVIVGAFAVAAPAAADIGITSVSPRSAHAGTVVSVTVDGYLGLRRPRMPIVIAPMAVMPKPAPCNLGICEPEVSRSRLNLQPYRVVGEIHDWRIDPNLPDHASAILRFRLPQVAPGLYAVALWCAPCVRDDGGGSLIAGGKLRIH